MAHEAKLKIEGKEYNLIECEYEFTQPTKDAGVPGGKPSNGDIELVLLTPDDNDLFLYDWMQSATESKDGQIIFQVVDLGNSTKTLNFKDGYCVRLCETFNAHEEVQMCTKITISAGEVTLGNNEKK